MFEKITNTAYCIGAAIVVFGAWGKIEHRTFGDPALTAGLLTEVVLFLVYGIMEWKKKPEQNHPIQTTPDNTHLQEKLDLVNTNIEKVFRIN